MCEECEAIEVEEKKRNHLALHLHGTRKGAAHPLDASPSLQLQHALLNSFDDGSAIL